jgi:RES domain-containing protein
VRIKTVYEASLPPDWRRFDTRTASQAVGTAWARSLETCVLSVPSVVVPHDRVYLLNPEHPEFGQLIVGQPERFQVDPRFLAR